jgi:hypothetical protein
MEETPIEQPSGGEVQGIESTGDNSPGLNPAWEPVLSLLPEQFHNVVTPHFQQWDQAAQSKIEAANSSLKEFEPFKPLLEHGISFDEVTNGLRLAYEINNNPENVYKALVEAYKFGQQPETPNEDNEGESDLIAKLPPELQSQLGQQGDLLKTVAQIVLNDAQAKQQATADKELDDELNSLREKIGDYDERYVLSLMQGGMSAEEAGQAFVELKQSFNQSRPFAPTVLGGSGGSGIPSNAIDPTKLSSKDTRSLVAQMLEQAAKQR